MDVTWIHLVILALATFRLTRLILYDEITSFIRTPFITTTIEYDEHGEVTLYKTDIKGTGLRYWIGTLLTCHWCVGIWSSAIIVALYYFLPSAFPLFLVLALAGASSLITYLSSK